jgi:hypothetical protein
LIDEFTYLVDFDLDLVRRSGDKEDEDEDEDEDGDEDL